MFFLRQLVKKINKQTNKSINQLPIYLDVLFQKLKDKNTFDISNIVGISGRFILIEYSLNFIMK